jgi:hypothetical protein
MRRRRIDRVKDDRDGLALAGREREGVRLSRSKRELRITSFGQGDPANLAGAFGDVHNVHRAGHGAIENNVPEIDGIRRNRERAVGQDTGGNRHIYATSRRIVAVEDQGSSAIERHRRGLWIEGDGHG